jgi:hypothetical protein
MVVLPLNPRDIDPEGDIRIRVYVYGCDTTKDELLFYFDADEHAEATDFAYKVSTEWRDVSRVQVIDAWGMLVAQFTAMWIILGEDRWHDAQLAKRSAKSELS